MVMSLAGITGTRPMSPDAIKDVLPGALEARAELDEVGLVYSREDEPGIQRVVRRGKPVYLDADGGRIRDAEELARIKSLAIPPAWSSVWVCPDARGHIQATGRDAKGRKQYRYHADFRAHRENVKFEHMLEFVHALPAIRATVDRHMAQSGIGREKVLATVVRLLETTLIRVGNEDYARQNGSFGLTTLRDRHVKLDGRELRFQFTGKSGKQWRLQVRDRRVARVVRSCQELPGQKLFQYRDDDGAVRDVSSTDINAYLQEISGRHVTAKDFRTWAGTVLAAMALQEFEAVDSQAKAKKNIRAAIEHVSSRLGNTPAICRKCYVHPEILTSYVSGSLLMEVEAEVDASLREGLAALSPEEAAVLALLRSRLHSETRAG
jgi:DNA topoisomerase-1